MKGTVGRLRKSSLVLNEVLTHFDGLPLHEIITAAREFPIAARVDLQSAVQKVLEQGYGARLLGIHRMYGHSTMTFADLLNTQHDPVLVGPLQHSEVDIGEVMPARCLRQGLWLCSADNIKFAVLLTPVERYGRDGGSHLEIAVPPGDSGAKLSRTLLDQVDKLVNECRSYRGKVISLEAQDRYGDSGAVKVHKLREVS